MSVETRCVAHGNRRCTWCSLNPADCGGCEHGSCSIFVECGMHWDTCQNRVRGPEDARERGLWPSAVPFPELGEGVVPLLPGSAEVVARLRGELRPARPLSGWLSTASSLGEGELAEALAREVGMAIFDKIKEHPLPPRPSPWSPAGDALMFPGAEPIDVGAIAAKVVLDVMAELPPWRRRRSGLRALADQVRRVIL